MAADKNFWITYHWAHPDPDDHPWNIYRKTLNRLDDSIEVGDEVLFYRGLRPFDRVGHTRLTHAIRVQNGVRTRVLLDDSPAGITRAGIVRELPRPLVDADIKYDYFSEDPGEPNSANVQSWHYITKCEVVASGGPVGLAEVQAVLGSKVPAHLLGLRRISREQYQSLRRLMQA
jgi:hypothetical protein